MSGSGYRLYNFLCPAAATYITSCVRQRSEVRALFLMEKYGRRWRQRTTQSAIAVNFLDSSWLRRVLFSPSSRLARRVAADMVETLASEPARKRRVSTE